MPPDVEVALFWDYENMPLGVKFSYEALGLLLQRARTFGRLVEARLYADAMKQDKTAFGKHGEALDHVGVTLVDCPTADKKEAVDKKIIVDACCFALPRAAKRQACCVVLVSSDGDFAHMLSRLSHAGVMTVAIGRSAVLRGVCDSALTLGQVCGVSGGVDGGGRSGGAESRRGAAAAAPVRGGKKRTSAAPPLPSSRKRQRTAAAADRKRQRTAAAASSSEAIAEAAEEEEEEEEEEAAAVAEEEEDDDAIRFGDAVALHFVACDGLLGLCADGCVIAGGERHADHRLAFEARGEVATPRQAVRIGAAVALRGVVAGEPRHLEVDPRGPLPQPVQARWADRRGAWQGFCVDVPEEGSCRRPLRAGDRLYLRCEAAAKPHASLGRIIGSTGKRAGQTAAPHIHAEKWGGRVVAQWHDRGEWQQLRVERATPI